MTIAKYSISWLKRFVDNDTRYEQFLCPKPTGPAIEEYRDTCPHSRSNGRAARRNRTGRPSAIVRGGASEGGASEGGVGAVAVEAEGAQGQGQFHQVAGAGGSSRWAARSCGGG